MDGLLWRVEGRDGVMAHKKLSDFETSFLSPDEWESVVNSQNDRLSHAEKIIHKFTLNFRVARWTGGFACIHCGVFKGEDHKSDCPMAMAGEWLP